MKIQLEWHFQEEKKEAEAISVLQKDENKETISSVVTSAPIVDVTKSVNQLATDFPGWFSTWRKSWIWNMNGIES